MSMGRPPYFETAEAMQEAIDGDIVILDHKSVKNSSFKSEKAMLEFIVANIDNFCRDTLSDELVEYSTEYDGIRYKRFGPRNNRVDLYIIGKKAEYLVELKNPRFHRENRAAIGQLLNYGREFFDSKKEKTLVLVTTKFDLETALTIRHYALPIRYIYLDKAFSMEYKRPIHG
jgi:hypothetical protein